MFRWEYRHLLFLLNILVCNSLAVFAMKGCSIQNENYSVSSVAILLKEICRKMNSYFGLKKISKIVDMRGKCVTIVSNI